MNLVRDADTRAVSYAILGGIKEVIGMLSRSDDTDISALVEEILQFGLSGVARPELLKFVRPRGEAGRETHPGNGSFFAPKLD
jgi:hypothetical protein